MCLHERLSREKIMEGKKLSELKEVTEFEPVVLILSSQEEVDKIYALLNNSEIADALELPDAYRELDTFKTDGYSAWQVAIDGLEL